ncbi:hypothetical protein GIB67_028871 [Kingdonia uniflora]|uniref:Fiber protein Fb34 n=1 Tax=Kingdonia uniflora TaxID=39325 RepID=A0A7J7LT78_9MAGN|nr:hypothetical protein GIB67_028871 [Kingdonia uniflora]
MAISITVLAIVISLHLIAFVFAIGAEQRRSTGKVGPDKYDERTFCVYDSDASTLYGLTAFVLLLVSQALVNGVTKCLCFGRGDVISSGGGWRSGSKKLAVVVFFVVSWLAFLGAEICLLAGSVRNAYHTKYRGYFGAHDFSCASLRKGVFSAGAALCLVSLLGSILYYWAHNKADTGGWEKHKNEGLGMAETTHREEQNNNAFEKV